VTEQSNDPHVQALREQITQADRAILDQLNARLRLVAEIRAYKARRGYDFVDQNRERELVDTLSAANAGPLSDAGLREVYAAILALMKRETADGS
jgi:chorismate mutase